MKKIYTLLASMVILLAVGIMKANAQVVDVCAGNDTVELRLGNFQYGYVQWQVSDDNETWRDIDGAVDTVYRFLPERPRYYRAEVKFPQCSEYDYHSQVTYVQIPPVADAGPDFATSPNMPVRLAASRFEGAVGEWSIIEGPFGGVFDNNSDPHALFMGSEGEYKLVWTLTNSCGSSTDTINVSCIPTVYNSNILIVDETDVILSDTLQMLNGEYSIVFTDTIPNIIEGTVLIGYREKPFLRKVTSFEKVGDVFVMQTEQATLADVVVSGAMCIDPIGDLDEGSKRVKVLDRYPTRKELVANPSLLNDGTICVIKGDYSKENMDDPEDPPIDLSFKIDDGKIELSAKINFKILDPDCDGLILKFEGEATPNFRINPKYEDQDMAKFSIGFYDNEVKHTIKLYAEKELNGIVVEGKGNINPHQLIIGGFLLFGVPTTVTLDFPYSAEASATIGGLEIEHTISYTNTHAVEWRDWGLEEVVKKSEPVKETKPFHITGNLEGKIEVGLKIGLLVADMVGPSVTVNGHFGPSLCYSITNPHTLTAELGWGVDSKIGGRLQLFSNKLGVNFEGHKTLYEDSEKAPKELVRAGGDQQVYNPMDFDFIQSGGFLPDDIKVNVKGWFGTNMPFAIVHFEPEEGDEVSDERVIANIHGIASVKWKPGSASGQHKLKARVFDCEGKTMAGSPLVFHAYTQGTGGCWNSGLTADFIEHVSSNGTKTIEFLVTGGEEPYEYSTDGINFDPLLQTISLIPQPGHTYVYYVRDKYGCEAEAYYNAPFDACDASTFALNVQVYNGNNIAVEAQGGIEPYWYSLDGINYSSNFGSPLPFYYFTNLVDGEYTVYAKDGLGCMRTQTVTIQREANIGIVITNAGFDMFGSPVGTVQMLASVPVIYDRGICWAEKTNASVPPTVEDFTRSYGSGSDDYDFTLQGLNSGTTYYVRAYILTDAGTAYSNTIEMMANYMVTKPYVYVTAVSSLTNNSANCSSNVINDGNAEVTDRGFCWSATNPSPTLADSHLSCGTGTGIFSGTLTDLESHTHYYIRAYATNNQGTGYGLVNQFTSTNQGGGGAGDAPEGAIDGLFSVGEDRQVYFSQGNLQYQASSNTWKFAENQWDYVGEDNNNFSATYEGWIDMFGWGTSGWDNGNVFFMPYDAYGWLDDCLYGPPSQNGLVGEYANSDWGIYNAIINGGNRTNFWRTLTYEEWKYLLESRNTASGCLFAKAQVNQVDGVVLLPDNWSVSYYYLNNVNDRSAHFYSNVISSSQWGLLESKGAVFLPVAGDRYNCEYDYYGSGHYWSSTSGQGGYCSAYNIVFDNDIFWWNNYDLDPAYGFSVRLVHPKSDHNSLCVTTYEIVSINPTSANGGGIVYDDSGLLITERGLCWSTTPNPTINDQHVVNIGTGSGSFSSPIIGLFANKRYYVRAYVTTNTGIFYGNEVSFVTPDGGSQYYPTGAVKGLFSVSEYEQAYFSSGNLQYKASSNTWKFAENQWDYIGNNNANISSSYNDWIDLFGWGTSGYNHGAICYQPWSISTNSSDYTAYGFGNFNLDDLSGKADWGYNAILNGGGVEHHWHTLSLEEWEYVLLKRSTPSGIRFVMAEVNGVNGLLIPPDSWNPSIYTLNCINEEEAKFDSNIITAASWLNTFEPSGAVFLPTAGYRDEVDISGLTSEGNYWSTNGESIQFEKRFYGPQYYENNLTIGTSYSVYYGHSVRLITKAESHSALPQNVTTLDAENVTNTNATCTGYITSDGGNVITDRGFCWSNSHDPTIADSRVSCETGIGSFQAIISGLTPGYTYHARAYAINVLGITYGNEITFTTSGGDSGDAPEGAIDGVFSVSEVDRVFFSKGNLQYIGSAATPYWKFAEHQWDYLGDNGQAGNSPYVDRDLFAWGTSGINHGAVCYQPWSSSNNAQDYYAYGGGLNCLYDQDGTADWGYNAIANGGNVQNQWRTLKSEEWSYLFDERYTESGIRFAWATVNNIKGIIIVPDNWDETIYHLEDPNNEFGEYSSNLISSNSWNTLETAGAVFLPAAGDRTVYGNNNCAIEGVGEEGRYYSSSTTNEAVACYFWFTYHESVVCDMRYHGRSVRLVQDATRGSGGGGHK